MSLVIFDIDATLTRTMKADEECFVRSFAEVCGFNDVDTDWSRYKHATDSGVFHEIYEFRTGRSPLPSEISRFRQHFVALLAQASSKASFTAVAGAAQLLSRLADSAEHRVALATGAWRHSARLKMTSAGLCYDDYPAAPSDDALDRESIADSLPAEPLFNKLLMRNVRASQAYGFLLRVSAWCGLVQVEYSISREWRAKGLVCPAANAGARNSGPLGRVHPFDGQRPVHPRQVHGKGSPRGSVNQEFRVDSIDARQPATG